MAQITLPGDFKEFLRLLGARGVEYLLVGGYAVGHHGYPRYTADIDVWVPIDMGNAERLTTVLRDFGFDMPEVNPELFLRERMIIRMGVPPMRIDHQPHRRRRIPGLLRATRRGGDRRGSCQYHRAG